MMANLKSSCEVRFKEIEEEMTERRAMLQQLCANILGQSVNVTNICNNHLSLLQQNLEELSTQQTGHVNQLIERFDGLVAQNVEVQRNIQEFINGKISTSLEEYNARHTDLLEMLGKDRELHTARCWELSDALTQCQTQSIMAHGECTRSLEEHHATNFGRHEELVHALARAQIDTNAKQSEFLKELQDQKLRFEDYHNITTGKHEHFLQMFENQTKKQDAEHVKSREFMKEFVCKEDHSALQNCLALCAAKEDVIQVEERICKYTPLEVHLEAYQSLDARFQELEWRLQNYALHENLKENLGELENRIVNRLHKLVCVFRPA